MKSWCELSNSEQNFYLANDVLNVRYDMDESDTGHRCDFQFYQLIPNQDLTIDNVWVDILIINFIKL